MTLQQERERAAEAQRQAEEEKHLYAFFRKHQDVSPNEANEGVIRRFLSGIEVSPGALEECYQILTSQDPCPLALRSEPAIEYQELRERKKLVQEILATYNAEQLWLENEEWRLNLKNPTTGEFLHDLTELRAIHEERALRQKFAQMTVQQLRAIVKPPERTPEIPPERFTAPILRAMSAGQLRQLVRVGFDALYAAPCIALLSLVRNEKQSTYMAFSVCGTSVNCLEGQITTRNVARHARM